MGFARGVLSATTPAQDLRTAIENLMPASGWTLVDTYTGSSPADSVRVWLNPAANNAAGIDFFVAIGIKAGTINQIWFSLAQIYNATTHLARKYAVGLGNNNGSITIDTDFTVTDTTGKGLEVLTSTPGVFNTSITLSTTGQGYAVLVTKDFIMAGGVSNLSSSSVLWAGRFVRDDALTADNCLGVTSNAGTGYFGPFVNGNAYTNAASTQALNQAGASTQPSNNYFAMSWIVDGFGSQNTDPYNNNKPFASRFVVGSNAFGAYRGYVRDVLYIPNNFSNYDDDITISISGTTYTYGRMGSSIWVNKGAV